MLTVRDSVAATSLSVRVGDVDEFEDDKVAWLAKRGESWWWLATAAGEISAPLAAANAP